MAGLLREDADVRLETTPESTGMLCAAPGRRADRVAPVPTSGSMLVRGGTTRRTASRHTPAVPGARTRCSAPPAPSHGARSSHWWLLWRAAHRVQHDLCHVR